MNFEHIDNGFHQISLKDAWTLAKRVSKMLPEPGREALVPAPENFPTTAGFVWLARTITNGKQVWSIRDAKHWRLVGGQMRMS